MGKICGSARGEYGLSTDLGACRHAVEILVHAELSLRSGYGFTPSTDDAGTSTAPPPLDPRLDSCIAYHNLIV